MKNRELVMLAKNFKDETILNWYWSEKLDGMRCLWIPETRGINIRYIPFANNDKKERLRDEVIATGLWSRYGNVIHCPPSFVERLPNLILDGELYIGRGRFQETMSIVKEYIPGPGWVNVKFKVFDVPSYFDFCIPGQINNPNYKCLFKHEYFDWLVDKRKAPSLASFSNYGAVYNYLQNSGLDYVQQNRVELKTNIIDELEKISSGGGEGIILRHPGLLWTPYRTKLLLKLKPLLRETGEIIDWTPGIGKLDGLMGSLKVRWRGIIFDLSGFTDAERVIGRFKIGDKIKFKFRELTDNGTPKEARYDYDA